MLRKHFTINKLQLFLLSLFLLVLSIILYIYAPDYYSKSYTTILMLLFLIHAFIIVKSTTVDNNYFTFHILFVISYFFVNFVYPVFLFPIKPEYFPVYRKPFDYDVITASTALALVGIAAFGFGSVLVNRRSDNKIKEYPISLKTLKLIGLSLIVPLFLLMIYFGGADLLNGLNGATVKIPPGLIAIFQVAMGVYVILVARLVRRKNIIFFLKELGIIYFAIFLLYIYLFLFSGDRGPVIQIVLILLGSISLYIRSINLKTMVLITIAGMFFLTLMSYARLPKTQNKHEEVTLTKGFEQLRLNRIFDLGMDLIVNNRNLYVGYDYVSNEGINYGKSMFHYLFAPIPGLPSLMTTITFNESPQELTTASTITNQATTSYGLGTNMIVDIYMAFGFIGVILFMFFFGMITTYLHIQANLGNNIYYLIAYMFFISFVVYLPRTTIWEPFRHIVWGVLLMKFLFSLRFTLLKHFGKRSIN